MTWRRFLPEKLTVAQLFIQFPVFHKNTSVHYYFHHSPTHTLSPNSFSPPPFCSHTYSSLNNIPIMAHMFNALQLQCWHSKMRNKKSETLTNHWTPNLMYRSQIGTNNTWCSSNLKTPLNYIIRFQQTINSVHNGKHNLQTKLSALTF